MSLSSPRSALSAAARPQWPVPRTRWWLPMLVHGTLVALLLLSLCEPALAQTGGDPWTNPLRGLAGMLNGTVARTIGTIALFAAGGMLVFGGELNEFTKKILMVVVAVAVMALGAPMIEALFPA
jgi:type IV secretion system protein VirB2